MYKISCDFDKNGELMTKSLLYRMCLKKQVWNVELLLNTASLCTTESVCYSSLDYIT